MYCDRLYIPALGGLCKRSQPESTELLPAFGALALLCGFGCALLFNQWTSLKVIDQGMFSLQRGQRVRLGRLMKACAGANVAERQCRMVVFMMLVQRAMVVNGLATIAGVFVMHGCIVKCLTTFCKFVAINVTIAT